MDIRNIYRETGKGPMLSVFISPRKKFGQACKPLLHPLTSCITVVPSFGTSTLTADLEVHVLVAFSDACKGYRCGKSDEYLVFGGRA